MRGYPRRLSSVLATVCPAIHRVPHPVGEATRRPGRCRASVGTVDARVRCLRGAGTMPARVAPRARDASCIGAMGRDHRPDPTPPTPCTAGRPCGLPCNGASRRHGAHTSRTPTLCHQNPGSEDPACIDYPSLRTNYRAVPVNAMPSSKQSMRLRNQEPTKLTPFTTRTDQTREFSEQNVGILGLISTNVAPQRARVFCAPAPAPAPAREMVGRVGIVWSSPGQLMTGLCPRLKLATRSRGGRRGGGGLPCQ